MNPAYALCPAAGRMQTQVTEDSSEDSRYQNEVFGLREPNMASCSTGGNSYRFHVCLERAYERPKPVWLRVVGTRRMKVLYMPNF